MSSVVFPRMYLAPRREGRTTKRNSVAGLYRKERKTASEQRRKKRKTDPPSLSPAYPILTTRVCSRRARLAQLLPQQALDLVRPPELLVHVVNLGLSALEAPAPVFAQLVSLAVQRMKGRERGKEAAQAHVLNGVGCVTNGTCDVGKRIASMVHRRI